jgi:hypothetical protein
MRKFSNLKIIVFLTVLLAFNPLKVSAPPREGSSPSQRPANARSSKYQSPQERRQQLEQEAAAGMTEVEAEYTKILAYVNSAQTPSDPNLKESLKIIAKNRKYLPVLNNSQKSTYHILSAWVYYFDNKQDKASKQAASGQKVAPQNQNTIKTRLALSIIYRDYTSVIEALTEQSADNRPVQQTDKADSQSYQQTSQDNIQLDASAVRIELLGRVFDSQLESVADDSPPWRPIGRLACALLWKIDANELDSFAPAQTEKPAETDEPNKLPQEPNLPVPPVPEPLTAVSPAPPVNSQQNPDPLREPDEPGAIPPPTTTTSILPPQPEFQQQSTTYQQTLVSELEAFSQLQNLFEKNKRTVFAGINLNDPEKRKNLVNWLSKNPQPWQTFIFSPEGQKKFLSCFSDGFDKPILLIVAPDSTIRYAGNVEGFLPQMVIRNILANPQEFAEPNEPNRPPADEPNLPAVELLQPAQLPAKPNIVPVLTADANKTAINTQQPQIQPQTDANTASPPAKQQVDEDSFDPQAEDLIEHARAFLKINNVLPYHMYRDPIEWCRRVIKNYPGTKYAQEAQMLLRRVPERFREQYNLTDEELGL